MDELFFFLRSLIQRLIYSVLFSNLFISVSSITLTLSSFILLNTQFSKRQDIPFLLFIFSSTFLTYNIHIWYEKFSESPKLARNKWRKKHTLLIKAMFVCSLIVLLGTLFFISGKVIWFAMHLAIFSIFYSAPLFNFKRIPFLKIFLIAYVWSVSTVVLPALNKGYAALDTKTLEVFAERFIFIFALAIPFDIRDIEVDRRNNIDTLPSLIGFSNSKLLSVLLLVIFAVCGYFLYGLNFIFISRCAISIVAILLIVKIKRSDSDLYYMFSIDGIMILSYIFLLLSWLIFSPGS